MTHTQGEHAQTESLAHELFAAAQLAPGEGIEDAVSRIAAALTEAPSVATSATGGDWTQPTTVAQRLGDAVQLLCGGKRPPEAMVAGWLDHSSEELQSFCAEHGPSWAQGIGMIDAAMVMVDQPTEITTIDHQDRDHEHRTPAQPAPHGAAYAELPEPDVRRLAIESGLIRKADALRPTTWGRILRFAQEIHALRASNGQAPASRITVEQVEDAIGLQSTAWDTIGAEKIVEAVLRLANGQAPAGAADELALTRQTNLAVVQRLQAKINALEAELDASRKAESQVQARVDDLDRQAKYDADNLADACGGYGGERI